MLTRHFLAACILLAASVTELNAATIVFDRGAVNSAGIPRDISAGSSITNPFTVGGNFDLTAVVATLVAQSAPIAVNWSIGTDPFAAGVGSGTGSGITPFSSVTQVGPYAPVAGYNYYQVNFSVSALTNIAPGNYYLTLAMPSSTNVFWAINSSGGTATQRRPALTDVSVPANSFQIIGDDVVLAPTETTPEPTSMALWGLGALGCSIAAYRRRKHAA